MSLAEAGRSASLWHLAAAAGSSTRRLRAHATLVVWCGLAVLSMAFGAALNFL